MKVKLVSITKPLITIGGTELSPEAFIIYCARVSSPNQENTEYEKLLLYCINHKHWSIFEQVDMGVEIITSRGIAPQILRHKSFSFQEFSQRYAPVTAYEEIELRLQGDSKQGSSEVIDDKYTQLAIANAISVAQEEYEYLLGCGVSRETARMILPLCAQTKIYMKGSIRSWIHYLQVRLEDDTQKEHREIAKEILTLFATNFPLITNALFSQR